MSGFTFLENCPDNCISSERREIIINFYQTGLKNITCVRQHSLDAFILLAANLAKILFGNRLKILDFSELQNTLCNLYFYRVLIYIFFP